MWKVFCQTELYISNNEPQVNYHNLEYLVKMRMLPPELTFFTRLQCWRVEWWRDCSSSPPSNSTIAAIYTLMKQLCRWNFANSSVLIPLTMIKWQFKLVSNGIYFLEHGFTSAAGPGSQSSVIGWRGLLHDTITFSQRNQNQWWDQYEDWHFITAGDSLFLVFQ